MDFKTILLLLGAAGTFFSIIGVATNLRGDPHVRIVDPKVRVALFILGLSFTGASIHLDHRDNSQARRTREDDQNDAAQKRRNAAEAVLAEQRSSERALSAHLSTCTLWIAEFERKFPQIPGIRGRNARLISGVDERNVHHDKKPLDMTTALENAIRGQGASSRVTAITASGGVGKSVVIRAMSHRFCKENLAGNYSRVVLPLDAREDLGAPRTREALTRRIRDLASAVGRTSAGGQLVVLIDSFDELFFENERYAEDVLQWMTTTLTQPEEAKPTISNARFIVLTRPYAWTRHESTYPVIGHFSPRSTGTEYRDDILRSIAYRRSPLPASATDVNEYLDREVNRSVKWLQGAGLGEGIGMTYRDLELALDGAAETGQPGTKLGEYYLSFARKRTSAMLHNRIQPARVEKLLMCAAARWAGDKASESCRDLGKRADTELEAAGLLGSEEAPVPSPLQDVVAAYAFCTASQFPQEHDERWIAIAATSSLKANCPRLRERTACNLAKEVQLMFTVNCPNEVAELPSKL